MKLLFVDTECNSLDTQFGFIQELAWGLYDARSKRLLSAKSSLLRWNMQYQVDPGAFEVTGLTREFCESQGRPAPDVFSEFLLDVAAADAICGHNYIEYDKKMLLSNILRAMFNVPDVLITKMTFDTMFDLPIKNPRQVMALKYLSLDHGYVLSDAHQALADVFACATVFFKYPLDTILEIAQTQIVTMIGHTDWHDVEGREAFYRQKFRWNRVNKRWERKCRAYYMPGTQLELKREIWLENPEPSSASLPF